FDFRRTILLARVQKKPLAHDRLLHLLQAPDADLTDLDTGAGFHVKADIEYAVGWILVSDGGVDLRKGVALVLEPVEQPVTGGQHIRGDGGCAALQSKG